MTSSESPFNSTDLTPATWVVAAGRPAHEQGSPVNASVVMSSTFVSQGVPDGVAPAYMRAGTPAWEPLEELISGLERASEPATLFASGMGALSAALHLVRVGGTVVAPKHSYNTMLSLAESLEAQGRLRLECVDVADDEATARAIEGLSTGDMLWLETPTNPMLEICDLRALSAAAHERGALVVADNTLATPLAQRPLELGVDVVVHSLTKYFAGHSDLLMGAAVTSDPELQQRIRTHRTLHGAITNGWDAYLALRGARTMSLRVERAQENAAELARRLEADPRVAWVRHPSLASHPGHELAARQMTGFGSIVAWAPRGDDGTASRTTSDTFVSRVRLWTPATSLGGVESTIERRRRHGNEPTSVPEELIRLSVGVEEVDDLWRDLDQAFGG